MAKWDWAIVRDLGSGGQGKTSLVRRRGDPPDTITELLQHLKILITDSSSNAEFIRQQRERLPDTLHSIISKSDYGLFVQKRLLDPDQESIERLALEARVYRTINDPHLLRIIDQDEKWIVTEYQPNGTLESRLEGFRGDSIKTLKTIRPIVGVISKMHAEGFVHRDFKPANIFIGPANQLVLGDAGLAFELGPDGTRVTQTHESVGTKGYMRRGRMAND